MKGCGVPLGRKGFHRLLGQLLALDGRKLGEGIADPMLGWGHDKNSAMAGSSGFSKTSRPPRAAVGMPLDINDLAEDTVSKMNDGFRS